MESKRRATGERELRCHRACAGSDALNPACTRKLIYIPIVHTLADLGALGSSLQRMKALKIGRERAKQSAEVVEKIWDEIERRVDTPPSEAGLVRLYQDGLPACGHESQIVSDLAQAGSRNHKLLLRLQSKGAVLMGTESPELLVEEYQLATEAVYSHAVTASKQQKRLSAALLDKRDRYIAARIDSTLQAGETGMLFIGMLHAVESYLPEDIEIIKPLQAL